MPATAHSPHSALLSVQYPVTVTVTVTMTVTVTRNFTRNNAHFAVHDDSCPFGHVAVYQLRSVSTCQHASRQDTTTEAVERLPNVSHTQ